MLKADNKLFIAGLVWLGFIGWWVTLQFGGQGGAGSHQIVMAAWFSGMYGFTALLGGIWGLVIARQWGGWRSVMGRTILMFAAGLLAEEFGQLAYGYYEIMQHNGAPYPSVGDVGYLGGVMCYAYGTILLSRVAGVRISLRRPGKSMVFLLLPFAALLIAYVTFLGLGSTGSHVFTTLFTIGYLLGQAVSVAFVALVLVRSQRRLGGIMRSKVLLLLLIPLTQHVADLNFLFQAHQRTWVMGSYGDVLYLVSYGLMTLAILNISTTSLAAAQRSKALADSTAIDTDTGLPTPSERLRLAANTP